MGVGNLYGEIKEVLTIMELEEQLEKIEQLRTDKYIQMLLLAMSTLGSLVDMSDRLLENHKAKNPTINNKMIEYRNDLIDEFDLVSDKFYSSAIKDIAVFCGFHEDSITMHELLFKYSSDDLNLDDLIQELNQEVIDITNIPEGHIMIKSKETGVQYISEADHKFAFIDDED